VRRGWLQRRRSQWDARAYVLKLTGEGRDELQGAEPLGQRVDARILAVLPEGRRSAFVEALARIVCALETSAKTAGRASSPTQAAHRGQSSRSASRFSIRSKWSVRREKSS
jgi:hypothetical protein